MKKRISTIACCLLVFLSGSTIIAQKTADDFYELSQKRLMNRDVDGALAALDKAIELKPEGAELYPIRSELRMMKGQVEGALADVDRALLLDPEMSPAYLS